MTTQKQSSRGVLNKRCSENMLQVYKRTPMPKCDFNNVASNFIGITFRHGCSPADLLHIFRTPLLKDTSGWLLLTTLTRHLCPCSLTQTNYEENRCGYFWLSTENVVIYLMILSCHANLKATEQRIFLYDWKNRS